MEEANQFVNTWFWAFLTTLILSIGALLRLVFLWSNVRSQNQKLHEKLRELEVLAQQQDLETIHHTLNPHLFKNTLNSIQSHAYQTYYAMDKLANVLDYILYESSNRLVTLKEEIEFANSLIEINKLKVSPLFDLRVKHRLSEANPLYSEKLIAPQLTVDLIENAFKHADFQGKDAFIAITFELTETEFSLLVSNRVSPKGSFRKERSGLGTVNFKKRLQIIYKSHQSLTQFVEDGVYVAHLKIDLLGYETEMHSAGR